MTSGRQYATAVNGTTITFECERAQHTYNINFGNKPLHRRLQEPGCRLMARWWSREKGGCIGECPTCKRTSKGTKEP